MADDAVRAYGKVNVAFLNAGVASGGRGNIHFATSTDREIHESLGDTHGRGARGFPPPLPAVGCKARVQLLDSEAS